MYIYQLPFEINRELCRLLDMDDTWKELAGEQMMYSPFHVIVSAHYLSWVLPPCELYILFSWKTHIYTILILYLGKPTGFDVFFNKYVGMHCTTRQLFFCTKERESLLTYIFSCFRNETSFKLQCS